MLKSRMAADIGARVVDEWLVREACGPTRGMGDVRLRLGVAPVPGLSTLANCN
jgi:hypothetical protein